MTSTATDVSFPLVRGLHNKTEENKCFFNAVIQCLARTPNFLKALEDSDEEFSLPGGKVRLQNTNDEVELPPISGRLGVRGPLSVTLADTLNELQKFDEVYFNPEALFDLVTCVCPQFAGGEQHDCHEFMRQLLDKIKKEDLQRFSEVNKPPTRNIKLMKEERSQYIPLATEHIFSGRMFRGMLVSTLTCQECKSTSSRYEEFLDLSLPTYVDTMEEMVATKRNAPKTKNRAKSDRGIKRNFEPPVIPMDLDTDEDIDHNGNAVATESDNLLDDSPIICPYEKYLPKLESPKEPSVSDEAVAVNGEVTDVASHHHQLANNMKNMNMAEKKYKMKRTSFNSIEACLNNFTECEVMDENNKVRCHQCDTNTKATKQYLISEPPDVLILHLKRFEFGDHDRIRKISHHVKFSPHLDLSSYRTTERETMYSLYAVIHHKQRVKNNGHYIAFVKVRPNISDDDPRWQSVAKKKGSRGRMNSQSSVDKSGAETAGVDDKQPSADTASDATTSTRTQWYRLSDTDVQPVDECEVLKVQAYVLFYERDQN